MLVGPSEFPSTCGDVTMDGKPGRTATPNSPAADANTGEVSSLTVVPRAEVFEFQLSKFDVDRHELKRNHKDAIADFTKRIKAGIAAGSYTGEPLRVFTYGETSSTASAGAQRRPVAQPRLQRAERDPLRVQGRRHHPAGVLRVLRHR